jgi:prepilin-type N-terminal cleavage/methylation domain-containing protein
MTKKGFTLVELMVVVGILSIIMLVISQPVASVIKYQRESQTTDSLRDNLQFVINKMEKELKTSANVYVDDSGALRFKDQNGGFVTYSLANKVMQRNGSEFTDKDVFTVERLNFIVTDKPNLAKLVTVSIDAKSVDGKDSVSMQTSVLPVNDKPVIKDGLIVHLDAGNRNSYSGTTPTQWKDISGNNKNLTLSGNPTKSNDDSGYIQFDGNGDYASIGSTGLSTGNVSHSIEMWVKFDQLSYTDNSRWWLLNLGGYGKGSHHLIGRNGSSGVQFGVFAGDQLNPRPQLSQGFWLYIASTYDNINNSYSVYIKNRDNNGSLETYSRTLTDSGKFELPLNQLHIGKKWDSPSIPDAGPETDFKGKISNFRLYNRALTSSEVEYNYNVTKGRFGIQ